MGTCQAIKGTGERCKSAAMTGGPWCYNHDPAHAEQRRRNAVQGGRKGGRGRGAGGELQEIRAILRELTEGVISGETAPGPAAVAGQLLNTRLRALEVGRRSFDMGDLLTRLEAVEAAASRLRGAS